VDALICFHSDGFPYLMAWRYVQKHRPFLINNLDKQQLLWDRTVVYDILKKIKVPVAKHYFIFRDHDYLEQI
jgi:inositol hexakisphosphate/diphosphoinositol-pentakisphosphate kinase